MEIKTDDLFDSEFDKCVLKKYLGEEGRRVGEELLKALHLL